MAEVVEDLAIVHVQRPGLPWRKEQSLTECGLPVAGHPVISRADFLVKLKREGERRARYSTCQTCLDTASRWPSWNEDPIRCLYREADRRWGSRRPLDPFRTELLALAALVERHPEEFAELLEDIELTVPLPTERAMRRPPRG